MKQRGKDTLKNLRMRDPLMGMQYDALCEVYRDEEGRAITENTAAKSSFTVILDMTSYLQQVKWEFTSGGGATAFIKKFPLLFKKFNFFTRIVISNTKLMINKELHMLVRFTPFEM